MFIADPTIEEDRETPATPPTGDFFFAISSPQFMTLSCRRRRVLSDVRVGIDPPEHGRRASMLQAEDAAARPVGIPVVIAVLSESECGVRMLQRQYPTVAFSDEPRSGGYEEASHARIVV
jgi:hypothetical protein